MKNGSLRPCEVTLTIDKQEVKKQGWFHCWEDFAETVGESALRGGPAAGQISFTLGIVELENGNVIRVRPWQVRFTDRVEGGICPGGCVQSYEHTEQFCEQCRLRRTYVQQETEG